MIVTVKLFARSRDLAGRGEVRLTLAEGATVAAVRSCLAEEVPSLSSLLPRCRVAVDEEFADDATPVRETSEVALIPPVSGG